jgi:protein-S-isoprenylcysteine O-methyltransferase Ste14
MIIFIIFFTASIIFIIISWPALFQPGSRKFYRFFSFEFLLILVLVNSSYWFYKPFSSFQIISWLLLIISLLLVLPGIYLLLYAGKPASTANIETTTCLVTTGIYKYVRHPLYSSLIFLGTGCLLKNPSLLAVSLFAVAAVFIYATALSEEKENILKFGDYYADYIKQSKMLVPFLF